MKISVKYKNSGFELFTCTLNTTKGSYDWERQEEFRGHQGDVMWHLPLVHRRRKGRITNPIKTPAQEQVCIVCAQEGISDIKGE